MREGLWALVLAGGLAFAQSFLGLVVEDRGLLSYGQASVRGYWFRLGADHNLEWSAHAYLRRGGVTNPLLPALGVVGLGWPGAYYAGLGLEGGNLPGPEGGYAPLRVGLSALWGMELYLGDRWALVLEALAPLYGPAGARAGFGVRYYPSGREAYTEWEGGNWRLYASGVGVGSFLPLLALAYEGEGWALWATPQLTLPLWGDAFPLGFGLQAGGHAYLGSFYLGLQGGFVWGMGPLYVGPYLGYRVALGPGLEGRLALLWPAVFDRGTPFLWPFPLPSFGLSFSL